MLPFRGAGAPLVTDEEFDRFVETTGDFHVNEFDLAVPEERKQYEEIMTKAFNGWYVVYYVERKDLKRIVEWVQRYNELSPSAREAAANRVFPRHAPPANFR